jgi:hypothetical protein
VIRVYNGYWECFTMCPLSLQTDVQHFGGFLISNFRHVLNVLCFFLGNSRASEFYMPTFRDTLSVTSSWANRYTPMMMERTECSETSAYKIQTPGNYPEESIQHFGGYLYPETEWQDTTVQDKWCVVLLMTGHSDVCLTYSECMVTVSGVEICYDLCQVCSIFNP